jgi:hypothetical protein
MRAGTENQADAPTLMRDGAERHQAVLDRYVLDAVLSAVSQLPPDKAGKRLTGVSALNPFLAIDGVVGAIAGARLGPHAKPVRALLFDKTAQTNWKLGWHQDRTIAVRRRVEVPGYGPWSTKAGLQHVVPPFDLLAEMVTLRVHLDRADGDNAPLLIAPGSHRLGRVAQADIDSAVSKCGTFACLAEAGDIWLYATSILHASEAARSPGHRRVLQIDYSARDLAGGLDWLGV